MEHDVCQTRYKKKLSKLNIFLNQYPIYLLKIENKLLNILKKYTKKLGNFIFYSILTGEYSTTLFSITPKIYFEQIEENFITNLKLLIFAYNKILIKNKKILYFKFKKVSTLKTNKKLKKPSIINELLTKNTKTLLENSIKYPKLYKIVDLNHLKHWIKNINLIKYLKFEKIKEFFFLLTQISENNVNVNTITFRKISTLKIKIPTETLAFIDHLIKKYLNKFKILLNIKKKLNVLKITNIKYLIQNYTIVLPNKNLNFNFINNLNLNLNKNPIIIFLFINNNNSFFISAIFIFIFIFTGEQNYNWKEVNLNKTYYLSKKYILTDQIINTESKLTLINLIKTTIKHAQIILNYTNYPVTSTYLKISEILINNLIKLIKNIIYTITLIKFLIKYQNLLLLNFIENKMYTEWNHTRPYSSYKTIILLIFTPLTKVDQANLNEYFTDLNNFKLNKLVKDIITFKKNYLTNYSLTTNHNLNFKFIFEIKNSTISDKLNNLTSLKLTPIAKNYEKLTNLKVTQLWIKFLTNNKLNNLIFWKPIYSKQSYFGKYNKNIKY